MNNNCYFSALHLFHWRFFCLQLAPSIIIIAIINVVSTPTKCGVRRSLRQTVADGRVLDSAYFYMDRICNAFTALYGVKFHTAQMVGDDKNWTQTVSNVPKALRIEFRNGNCYGNKFHAVGCLSNKFAAFDTNNERQSHIHRNTNYIVKSIEANEGLQHLNDKIQFNRTAFQEMAQIKCVASFFC